MTPPKKPRGRGRSAGSISPRTRLALWVNAAGNCQYCNRPLLGEELSGARKLNKALIAHIVAASPDGPRGCETRSPLLIDDLSNLMLLCHDHHHLIDDQENLAAYPESRLLAMKAAHEARIASVISIDPSMGTHLLFYAAKIGEHGCFVDNEMARHAVLPARYPLENWPIALTMGETAISDDDPDYWSFQLKHLRGHFNARVRDRLSSGEIKHLSVFAVAPQPLLMELGRLLGELPDVDVRQLARTPKGWSWRDDGPPVEFQVVPPRNRSASPVVGLKLGLSATIVDERITSILGVDIPIWSLEAVFPGLDVLHRRTCLESFTSHFRKVLNDIKSEHGEGAEIHIFPALPVAAAVSAGRAWMPKSDLPLVIYDNLRTGGGFVRRHKIEN